jgi:hypothetical protein
MAGLPNIVKPPPVASAIGRLSRTVPRTCPADGCAIAHVRAVAGGDDRAPVAEVTFACGHRQTFRCEVAA